jgi:hypothetical protein
MIELIYYNQKGEVKSIEMLPHKDERSYFCTPQENYFVKGFTIKKVFLSKEMIFDFLKNNLTSLETHFLNIGYGFFPELTGYMFRNENEEFNIYNIYDILNYYGIDLKKLSYTEGKEEFMEKF